MKKNSFQLSENSDIEMVKENNNNNDNEFGF